MTPECEWPAGCAQPIWTGHLCTYHGKIADGLIDGRALIQVGKNGREAQDRLVYNLRKTRASEAVVERNAEPITKGGSSLSGGGGLPQGRLHSAGSRV